MKIKFLTVQKTLFDFNFLYKVKKYNPTYSKNIDFEKLESYFQRTLPSSQNFTNFTNCENYTNSTNYFHNSQSSKTLFFRNFLFQSIVNTMIFNIYKGTSKSTSLDASKSKDVNYSSYDESKTFELFETYIKHNRKCRLENNLIFNKKLLEESSRRLNLKCDEYLFSIQEIENNLVKIRNYDKKLILESWWEEPETIKFLKV